MKSILTTKTSVKHGAAKSNRNEAVASGLHVPTAVKSRLNFRDGDGPLAIQCMWCERNTSGSVTGIAFSQC